MPGIKECVCVHIGQAGCQVGFRTWELFTQEHGILENGTRGDSFSEIDPSDDEYMSFFHETGTGQHVPRAVFVDTEPSVINDIKSSVMSGLFHPESLISFKQDAKGNFFEGRMLASAFKIQDVVMDRLRLAVELCDNFQGFLTMHSIGGGTGSGVGVEVLHELKDHFDKKSVFQPLIYPSANFSSCIVEPYNTILALASSRHVVDLSLMLDNQAAYRICETQLQLKSPHFSDVNRLIAQCISGSTGSLRYESELNSTFSEQLTNLVPCQPFRYAMVSLAPLRNKDRDRHEQFKTGEIVSELFEASSLLCDVDRLPFNRYLAATVILRGEAAGDSHDNRTKDTTIKPGQTVKATANMTGAQRRAEFKPINVNSVVSALQGLRNPAPNKTHTRAVKFAPWMDGSGFKIGVIKANTVIPKNFALAASPRQGVVLANNTAVRQLFVRQYAKFLRLLFHKAYIWQFENSGATFEDIDQAKNEVRDIIDEYEKCLTECAADENHRSEQAGSTRRIRLHGATSEPRVSS